MYVWGSVVDWESSVQIEGGQSTMLPPSANCTRGRGSERLTLLRVMMAEEFTSGERLVLMDILLFVTLITKTKVELMVKLMVAVKLTNPALIFSMIAPGANLV